MNRPLAFLIGLIATGLIVAPAQANAAGTERALQRAEALLGAPASAAATLSASETRRRSAGLSALLRDVAVGLPELSGEQRRRAITLLRRPDEKSDPDNLGKEAASSPLCDANFCIHWSTSNRQAPSGEDSPPNGIPDYVESVADAAATSHAIENGTLGWREAKSDGNKGARNGRGGDGQVDVYITDLSQGLFGYASPDFGERGRSRAGYLVVDNDYKGFGGSPLNLMRVTMAHEYNHILQFTIDTFQDVWMFESTATWVENEVFPDIDDYLNFLGSFAGGSTRPMATSDNRDQKIYGSAVWNHWLSGRFGPGVIREAWEVSPDVKPSDFAIAAYESAIRAGGGGSFSEEFSAFAAATAEWNSSPAFPDSALYPDMKRRGKLGKQSKKLSLDHTAYRLMNVSADSGTARLAVKIEKKTRSGIALVGRSGPIDSGSVTVVADYSGKGGQLEVELPAVEGFDRVTAVLVNADGRLKKSRYRADGASLKAKLTRGG